MTSPHAPAPEIAGFTLLRHLGSGGYSDVFLYEQASPRMQVAVKVLPGDRLDGAERAQFEAEAQTMAQLSGHPHIVQVFTTGLTNDGRPYLVMTYYPPPNLAERVASNRLPIGEVLRIGIQISSAVQLAHESGILHRDIKPANILISQYGEPGLADFGIAGRGDAENAEDLGVSTPWCAPEVLAGGSNGTFQSDVYSLAATVWNLLVGRSPFEISGGDNGQKALTARVLRGGPPPTGRADVPASLERLLAQSMAKNPRLRPRTALDFAQSLQGIEQELRLPRTKIPGSAGTGSSPGPRSSPATPSGPTGGFAPPAESGPRTTTGGERTIQRPMVVPDAAPISAPIGPTSPPTVARPPVVPMPRASRSPAVSDNADGAPETAPETTRRPAVAEPQPGLSARARVQPSATPAPDATIRRPATPGPPTDAVASGRRGPGLPVIVGAAVLVLVAIAAIGLVLTSGGKKKSPELKDDLPTALATDQTAGLALAPAPPKVKATYNAATKSVTFSWTDSTPKVGFGWYPGTDSSELKRVNTASVTLRTTDPASTCISVVAIPLDGGTASQPSELVCG